MRRIRPEDQHLQKCGGEEKVVRAQKSVAESEDGMRSYHDGIKGEIQTVQCHIYREPQEGGEVNGITRCSVRAQ